MDFFAQAAPPTFWNAPPGSGEFITKLVVSFVLGFALIFLLLKLPAQARRPIVVTVTFLAGLFYVLQWLWPQPVGREPGTLPRDGVEHVSFWIDDAVSVFGTISNVLSAFLLGLGVYSILRIHVRKLAKMQQDWLFSGVLLVSMLVMILFGFYDWHVRTFDPKAAEILLTPAGMPLPNKIFDLLFEGLLQQMDAAMFSIIAFYILSAAYRAFRIRSVEATILLATALIVMLSLMGAVEFLWNSGVNSAASNDPNSVIQNFGITNISKWIQDTFQNSSLRAIDFGIGIGALAMGLRLWLSLERGGVSS